MLRIEMVTIDCRDPRALAEWWARQLGGRVLEGFEGDDYLLVAAEHGPRLGFQRVAEPTPGKNRVHLDVTAPDRELEVERLLAGVIYKSIKDPNGLKRYLHEAERELHALRRPRG